MIVATTDGGLSWKAQHVAGGTTPQLSGVSCPTPTECMAVGSNGAVAARERRGRDDHGRRRHVVARNGARRTHWRSPAWRAPAPSDCTAIVSDGTATWSAHSADFGLSWQQEGELPSQFLAGNDLTCVPGGSCLVAGYVPTSNGHGEGAVALSADGGQTWSLATVPPGVGLLQSAACLSVSVCLAVGTTTTTVSDVVPAKGELLRSTDGGHTWQPSTAPLPVDDIFDIACPSTTDCAMVGTKWVGVPAIGTGGSPRASTGG